VYIWQYIHENSLLQAGYRSDMFLTNLAGAEPSWEENDGMLMVKPIRYTLADFALLLPAPPSQPVSLEEMDAAIFCKHGCSCLERASIVSSFRGTASPSTRISCSCLESARIAVPPLEKGGRGI
jgi:hypothetical protein